MEQSIRFCTTSDGVTIAYSTIGQGTPMLIVPGWVTHLELDLAFPHERSWLEGLLGGGRRQLVRFDGRGTGLSDRQVDDVSFPARVRDIEAVADSLALSSFVLFAWSMGGPPAIVYATQHPQRVSHLILYASFARNFGSHREDVCRALLALMRAEWSIGSKTVVEFTSPGSDKALADSTAQYFRQAAPVGVATDILEEGMFNTDITPYLPRLTTPTLVVHRREDNAIPFECGRQLASLVPNARFLPLAGDAHPPFLGDQAPLLDAIDQFLGGDAAPAPAVSHAGHRASDLHIILFTDMEGSTTLTQRLGDAHAQEIVRTHNAIVREALKAHEGSEIKHTGDGLMASFHSASGAIECAITIQRALAERNAGVGAQHAAPLPGGEQVSVRIGLNAGEPVAEEADLFGTAVQLAARVCARAEPGQVLVSDVVRQLAAGKGFLFSDQGDVALRGFEDPVRLYEVRWQP